MTDAMTVQGQQSSSNPWLWTLGGAGLGTVGGATAANYGYGIPTQYAKTWEDAVANATKDDAFIKSVIDKGGDNKSNWELIQKHAKAVADAEKAVSEFKFPEGFNAKAELEAMWKAQEAYDKKYASEAFDKVLNNFKAQEWPNGFEHMEEGKLIKKYTTDEFKALLGSSKEEDKKIVEKIIKNHNEYKTLFEEGTISKELAKTEKEALENAKTAFEGKKGNAWTDDLANSYKALREKLAKTKKEAGSNITDDILKACKKPNLWLTALAAAAVLGIGGYLVGKSRSNA